MMSKLYLVTNKDTFARAIIAAPNALAARSMRPDSDLKNIVCRDGRWIRIGTTPGQDRPAPALPCWPSDVARVHADEIGTAGRMYMDTCQVLAFDRDAQLRRPSEGPDDSWGALFAQLGGS